ASHACPIVPILLPTEVTAPPLETLRADPDRVYRPVVVASDGLRAVIERASREISGDPIDPDAWLRSSYRPTPTIIEAARALYAHHSVEAIARFDAGAENLSVTSERLEELIDGARAAREKVICFVTGVPGAGKTLVGLNLATRHRRQEDLTHAVFLSGNGPLVAVLREALTRDEFERRQRAGDSVRK